MMGVRDEDTVSSLAGRLARLEKQLDDKERVRIAKASGGSSLTDIISGLIAAIDPDRIEETARETASGSEPSEEQRTQVRDKLVGTAASVFTGPLIELIDGIRRDKEHTIDHDKGLEPMP